ncbi:methyltransferase [Methylobacterium sp. Leaf113]|uniref:tRNA1(Val) (adenine(37)-N6)-methyltransferase n=1 Tax=Methylobacterium sp. Leaf113 TaxID=1736259 RepID=UPI0006F82498|nr:methyltransferase [Methylobacterium sp. Leaf113]KQP73652.1 methyltransferase [Methylobacterium sp. Leaf113]
MPDPLTLAPPDLWLGGRLRLHQPPRGGHRAGTDAVLLASLMVPEPGTIVCDVGASTGAVGLAVALRHPDARVVLVEREPELAGLARINANANGLGDRTTVIVADVLATGAQRRAAGLASGVAGLVLTNPPFFEPGRYRASPVTAKASAHGYGMAGPEGGLDGWLRTCADLLSPHGRLGLIHRADALPACLDALKGRFGAVTVRPVQARPDRPAIRILVSAVKGSRGSFGLLPALILQDEAGRFTEVAEGLNAGRGWIGQTSEAP